MNWADGLDVPLFDSTKHEYLLYVGCTASYDPRAQNTARALVQILNASGCTYGVLGEHERCCGECVFRLGHKPYFEEIAAINIEQFHELGVRKVIAISPHCYDALKNQYSSVDWLEPIHYAEYIKQALQEGKISLGIEPLGKLSFHDPCLLSRANSEMDTPREVLSHFEDLEFEELDCAGTDTLCCGGGGGRMFLETLPGERFSDRRIQDASDHDIQKLITTCPLCISCLEDSRAAMEVDDLQVYDLAELIASMMNLPEGE
jgi:Fe-S oxidoreductase